MPFPDEIRWFIATNLIHTLVKKIPTASKATFGHINKKIDELDEEHSRLKKEIADMSADIYGKKRCWGYKKLHEQRGAN